MEKSEYLIAVFDIGKTNKKFTIFTKNLKPIYSVSTKIPEIKINDIICDDVEKITQWMKKVLNEVPSKDKIKAISITTFGATGVLLNENDNLAFPVVSYNHEIDPKIKRDFYQKFGTPEELYLETGTPPYGQLLNFGIQLYWHKVVRPQVYDKTKSIIYLPHYLSLKLCGNKAIETTCVGCHTYLYSIKKKSWSSVAEKLEVPQKSPPWLKPWSILGKEKTSGAIVTVGIHDSNASLLPLTLSMEVGNFALASTGTWCVFMFPKAPVSPNRNDVYHDVLYYIDAFDNPVRSARFKGGYEFDYYIDLFSKKYGKEKIDLSLDLDLDLWTKILEEKELFIIPTLCPGSGQFPNSKGRIIGEPKDFKTAYHVLNLSIAIQTYYALKYIMIGKSLSNFKLIVAGGFAKNPMYLKMVATILKDLEVYKAKYPDLTSLGTAITAKIAYENIEPHEIDANLLKDIIGLKLIKPQSVERRLLMDYIKSFEELCTQQ